MRFGNLIVSKYGLVVGLFVLIVLFSILRPDVFPTTANFGSIMSDSAVLTLIALGVMVPLVVGQFDLSLGFVASLACMLTAVSRTTGSLGRWSFWLCLAQELL